MPQMNKGGKFVFGTSLVNSDLSVRIPTQAIQEYAITKENKVFLISGSKATGGFVVTRKELLYNTKIGNILKETPALCNYELPKGRFIKYKGRLYCLTNPIFMKGKSKHSKDKHLAQSTLWNFKERRENGNVYKQQSGNDPMYCFFGV